MSCNITLKNPAFMRFPHISCYFWLKVFECICLVTTSMVCRISLAESHARLGLRAKVEEEDALEVIQLYEESLTARFGKLKDHAY